MRLAKRKSLIRLSDQKLLDLLRQVSHMKDLDEATLRAVLANGKWRVMPSREYLTRQGDRNDSVFLLMQGRLQYEIRNADGKLTAREVMGSGTMIGDIGIFNEGRAVADVFSIRKSHILVVDGAFFKAVVEANVPALVSVTKKIVSLAAKGLYQGISPIPCRAVAVFPVDDSVPAEAFLAALTVSLEAFGRPGRMDKAVVEARFGPNFRAMNPDDPQYAEKVEFVESFATAHDFILLKADQENQDWNLTVSDQVDRILLLATAETPAALSPIEQRLYARVSALGPQIELVIVQKSGTSAPRDTKRVLSNRPVAAHHHVWLDRKDTVDRLARIITGNSVGLALGGGGARAAAHIGLLKAFKKHGIPVDHVGGTSIGSFIAALAASGLSPDEVDDVVQRKIVGTKLFNDYTFPVTSIVRGGKVSRVFQEIFGSAQIEDLEKDFFATAVNLTTERLEVFDRGDIWKAIRASSSLPAILPPLTDRGCLFVDGGLLDNIPQGPMRDRGAGFVVAVDVSGYINTELDGHFEKLSVQEGISPSIWALLKNKLAKAPLHRPSIGETITRSMVVGNKERALRAAVDADVYVKMPIGNFGVFDFDDASELTRMGYEHAESRCAAWKEAWLAAGAKRAR